MQNQALNQTQAALIKQMPAQALIDMVAQALRQAPAFRTSADLTAFNDAVDTVVMASMDAIDAESPAPANPDPDEIEAARTTAALNHKQAATLVFAHEDEWYWWERGEALMPRASWELFLLLTDQHPTHVRILKKAVQAKQVPCMA